MQKVDDVLDGPVAGDLVQELFESRDHLGDGRATAIRDDRVLVPPFMISTLTLIEPDSRDAYCSRMSSSTFRRSRLDPIVLVRAERPESRAYSATRVLVPGMVTHVSPIQHLLASRLAAFAGRLGRTAGRSRAPRSSPVVETAPPAAVPPVSPLCPAEPAVITSSAGFRRRAGADHHRKRPRRTALIPTRSICSQATANSSLDDTSS